ncbi:LAQU0S01e08570g1_1 [Lachancea quebecensis]|uniref:LAQU0S01e08570g1_1 n=1 Tax=Lachancea quebecensis TaxID=1654605 RepID=A0A0P1KN01_9SACH|nr:LAQU0S01e08570g1_1 [Lachancea quebecensis]
MASVLCLSKIDANLQDFKSEGRHGSIVNLSLNPNSQAVDLGNTFSDYSNTIRLFNEEYICYQFSHEYSVLSLYSLSVATAGKTIVIQLPERMLNMYHTFTIREIDSELVLELILRDGLYLVLHFPLNCILDGATATPENWFTVLNPYDFTVRRPLYAYSVSASTTIIFLEDGGLLGLTKSKNERGEHEVTPVLFNDNSYLQSLTKMFTLKRNPSQNSNVASCVVYRDRYLLTLTQNCKLRVWDLEHQTAVFEKDLATNEKHHNKIYETIGQFLSLYEDKLAIFLPYDNGMFQIWDLRLDGQGRIALSPGPSYASNLSSSSIWSLVDMKLTKPPDSSCFSGYMNLVVLWRSNSVTKLQILNLVSEDLQQHQWLEAVNQSLMDLRADLNLLTNGDTDRALMNLKSHYTPALYMRAQNILSESGILLSPESPYNHEYLLNLESVLKDLKKRNDEPSSLTLYHGEIIMINSLSLYSHALYKTNSKLESIFYNLNEEQPGKDDLGDYLRTIEGFASTLSSQVLFEVSEAFLHMVTSSYPSEIPIKERLTEIYTRHLDGNFHMANLRKLFDELSRLDVVATLNMFLDNHLQQKKAEEPLIDSIAPNKLANVALLESTHQAILVQNNLVLKALLIFAFMDFDYSIFQPQIKTLLSLHYKQCLWISLYQLNKSLLASEVFARTSKFGNGYKIKTYSDWSLSVTIVLNEIYLMPVSPNPLFIESFDKFVMSETKSSKLCNSYLKVVQKRFYIHSNAAHEFMLGLSYFMCGMYDRSFRFLQKHPYPDILPLEFPDRLYMPLQKDGHLWRDVIGSFKLPYKHSAYYFNLSKLFSVANSFEYALRCVKKSIKLSSEQGEPEEPLDFKRAQLVQYLNTLIVFSNYEEILDVLRCSFETLPRDVRAAYYKQILTSLQHRESFFARLLALCRDSSGAFLPVDDYTILDEILLEEVSITSWDSYKRLYSFRLINDHDRAAAEILYHYVTHGNSVDTKKKCLLLIINILSSFTSDGDRWILSEGNPITLREVKTELNAL